MMKMSLAALIAIPALAIPAVRTHAEGAPAVLRYTVAPDGNEARYRVREQLMHHDLPVSYTHLTLPTNREV